MIRFKAIMKQQVKEPTLQDNIKKFSKKFSELIQKYDIYPNFQLITAIQQFNQDSVWKITTVWQQEAQPYQIWCEYGYDFTTKTLEMSCNLSRNHRITMTYGSYYINLATGLFQKYSKQFFQNKQTFQFNINPLTGTIKIVSKVLIKQQQFKIQISRFDHLNSTIHQHSLMLGYCTKLIKLQNYLDGQINICPVINFCQSNLHKKGKNFITPDVFIYSINETLNQIDPNCQQNLDNFGNFENISNFVIKNEKQMPDSILKIIEMLKGKQKIVKKNMQVSTIINNIYDISQSDNQDSESQILIMKITIISDPKNIKWQGFAQGGFGLLQKAHVKYELCDLNNKNRLISQGEIVRKSDTKLTKIQHEKKIFKLLKNQQHPIIMPHYISDYYTNYIFSKFQPNLSLQKYIKANRKSISMLTIVRLMQHTVKGLLFLKQKGICHLDIKPNNIIVTKDLKAKISDFGQAFHIKQDPRLRQVCFTIPYAPPQIFYFEPYLNSKVDVYCFGVTMYKILFNEHIWGPITNKQKFLQSLLDQQPEIFLTPEKLFRFGIPQIIGVLTNLCLKCIKRQQSQRPSLFYLSIMLSLCRYYLQSLIEGGYYINS